MDDLGDIIYSYFSVHAEKVATYPTWNIKGK
jgi:hypothetical protein